MDFMEVQNVAKLLIAGLRVRLEHQDTVDGGQHFNERPGRWLNSDDKA